MKRFAVFLLAIWLCGCLSSETFKPEMPDSPPARKNSDERAEKLRRTKDSVAPFFEPMREPERSDWLASFPEPGQTFDEYLNENPTLPTEQRNTIYIQPVGQFSGTQRQVLRLTADYMKAFYSLPVKLNAETALENAPPAMRRRNPAGGQRQIKTQYFLSRMLPKMLPADAAALLCFTSADLWPGDEWNYVFGQATFKDRVGVWSLWRLGDPDRSARDYKRFLARTLKLAMHETGHLFSMRHCAKYECLMSGTNHLGETDRRPLDVCSECMAKISWAMNYEPSERYRNLADFWKKQDWTEEANSFLKKAEAISSEMDKLNDGSE
jgi:archaemetzincin